MDHGRLMRIGALGLALSALACGGGDGGGAGGAPPSPDDDGGAPGVVGDAGAPSADDAAGDDSGPLGGPSQGASSTCAPGTESIYVASSALDLYRFDPKALSVTKVGRMSCKAAVEMFTMTIDRTGIAWVSVGTGFWKIRVSDAGCVGTLPTSSVIDGAAFYADPQHPGSDVLFASVGSGAGYSLARVDEATGSISPVGPLSTDDSYSLLTLTSTGDGRLYSIAYPNPWQTMGSNLVPLARRDPATAAAMSSLPVTVPEAFLRGVVFWGGAFWAFTEPTYWSSTGPNPTPSVARIDPTTGAYTVVVPDLGFIPAGAGVSTCAPVAPPQ